MHLRTDVFKSHKCNENWKKTNRKVHKLQGKKCISKVSTKRQNNSKFKEKVLLENIGVSFLLQVKHV